MLELERVIENESSSSDIVIRATVHGLEITLDPMETPIRKLDVYREETDEFAEAVTELSRLVGGECEKCEDADADYYIEFFDESWVINCEACAPLDDPMDPKVTELEG